MNIPIKTQLFPRFTMMKQINFVHCNRYRKEGRLHYYYNFNYNLAIRQGCVIIQGDQVGTFGSILVWINIPK